MDLLAHVRKIIDRKPKAKRRFNLLREEASARPVTQKRLSTLASFVLFASIPLAGIWEIQSDLDPSLTPSRLSSQVDEVSAHDTILPGPSAAMCLIRNDGRKESGFFGLEKTDAVKDSRSVDSRPPWDDLRAGTAGLSAGSLGRGSLRNRPKKARLSRSRQAKEQVFFRKAQAYQKRKNFEMAIKMYKRVLQENPRHRDALFHLSSIYMEQSAYAEAYSLLRDLVHQDPGNSQALVNLAIAEIGLEKPEKAITHLDEALTLEDPPRFEIYLHRGVALSRLQRLEEATTWYRKAEELDPGRARLLFNMAVTFDKLERYKEALRLYSRFLEADKSPVPRERTKVEARIGVLTAYLAEAPKTSPAEGTH